MAHLTDAVNVGLFLGGRNFTPGAALGTNSSTTATASPNATDVPFTGGAGRSRGPSAVLAAGVAVAALLFDDTVAGAVCSSWVTFTLTKLYLIIAPTFYFARM